MKQFDAICLAETKCDSISDNEINGFKSFIMAKKYKIHKHEGIHGMLLLSSTHSHDHC